MGSVQSWLSLNTGLTTIAIGGSCLLYYIYSRKLGSRALERESDAVFVGRVSQVILYPVKSTRQMEEQDSLFCDHMGMKTDDCHNIRDRSWMVTLEGGSMISQRAEPKLALVQPSFTLDGEYLQLDAPGMNTLKVSTSLTKDTSPLLDVNVWGLHSEAIDCGQEASDWLCKYLGKKGHILVYHPPSMEGRIINDGSHPNHKLYQSDNKVAFAEMAPVLLMTESSVEDVNRRVEQMTLTMANFRPNICIVGPGDPYEEDKWDKIYIGDKLVLENTLPAPRNREHDTPAGNPWKPLLCSLNQYENFLFGFQLGIANKCSLTTVDPETGIIDKDKEPLESMTGYRIMFQSAPCLGLFMSVLHGGKVKVGDPVYATYKKSIGRDK